MLQQNKVLQCSISYCGRLLIAMLYWQRNACSRVRWGVRARHPVRVSLLMKRTHGVCVSWAGLSGQSESIRNHDRPTGGRGVRFRHWAAWTAWRSRCRKRRLETNRSASTNSASSRQDVYYNMLAPVLYEETIRAHEAVIMRRRLPINAETGIHTGRSPKDKHTSVTPPPKTRSGGATTIPSPRSVLHASRRLQEALGGHGPLRAGPFGGADPAFRVKTRVITELPGTRSSSATC